MTRDEYLVRLMEGRRLSPVTARAQKDQEGDEEESGGSCQTSPQDNLQVSAQQAPGGSHGRSRGWCQLVSQSVLQTWWHQG